MALQRFLSSLMLPITCLVVAGLASAETKFVAINSKGTILGLPLGAGELARVDKVVFWTQIRGNVSSPLLFEARVPPGAITKLFGMRLKTRKASAELLTKGRQSWYVLKEGQRENVTLNSVTTTTSTVAPTTTNVVSGFTLLHQDACGSRRDSYVVLIEVDITRLTPDQRANPLLVGGGIKMIKYKGSKAAALKPVSDGRFAPQPIMLMTTTGAINREDLLLASWTSNRLRKIQSVGVDDYVFARGKMLTRSVISKYLKGGKGVFDLFGPNGGYGVCFDLQRRRQERNGY